MSADWNASFDGQDTLPAKLQSLNDALVTATGRAADYANTLVVEATAAGDVEIVRIDDCALSTSGRQFADELNKLIRDAIQDARRQVSDAVQQVQDDPRMVNAAAAFQTASEQAPVAAPARPRRSEDEDSYYRPDSWLDNK